MRCRYLFAIRFHNDFEIATLLHDVTPICCASIFLKPLGNRFGFHPLAYLDRDLTPIRPFSPVPDEVIAKPHFVIYTSTWISIKAKLEWDSDLEGTNPSSPFPEHPLQIPRVIFAGTERLLVEEPEMERDGRLYSLDLVFAECAARA